MARFASEIHHRPFHRRLWVDAKTRNQTSEIASNPDEPRAISAGEALNNRPNALAAQKLIQEARQQVARSHHLIERGRKLGQKAEETLQAFRKPPEGCVGQSLAGPCKCDFIAADRLFISSQLKYSVLHCDLQKFILLCSKN